MMEVSSADKAVATDELVDEPAVEYFQVASRLEAVLTTLLENKFAAIKSLTRKTKAKSRLHKLFSPARSQGSSSLPTNQQLTAFDSLQSDSDQPCFGSKSKSSREQWKHQRHYDDQYQYRNQHHHHHHSHQHHHHHHHRHHHRTAKGHRERSPRPSQHFHHHHHHRRHRSHSNHRSFKRKKYSDSDTEMDGSPGRRHARKKGRTHHHRRMPSQSSDPEGNGDARHSPCHQSSFSLTDIERYDCDVLHYMECDRGGQLFIASPRPTTDYPLAAPTTTTCTCHTSVTTPASNNMLDHNAPPCYLMGSTNAQINIHYDEDYLSVNIEEDEDVVDEDDDDDDDEDVDENGFVEREIFEPDELIISSGSQTRRKHRSKRRKKHRRKRYDSSGRRRRHHHHHHHHHITMIAGDDGGGEIVRPVDPDDLPPRARWTIVATACLLLLMCLLLVGVTLRMAPLIDEMVRKENEELMHTLSRDPTSFNTNQTSPLNQSKLLSSLTTS